MEEQELRFVFDAFVYAVKSAKVTDTQHKLMTFEFVHHLAEKKIIRTEAMVNLVESLLNRIAS